MPFGWCGKDDRGRKFADYLSAVLVGPLLVVTVFGLLASVHSNTLVQRVLEIRPIRVPCSWPADCCPSSF